MNAGQNNTSGTGNAFLGNSAGNSNTTGSSNSFLGYNAGLSNTSGYSNTAVGYKAGSGYNGYQNTFVGDSTDATVANLKNASAIGHGATVSTSNAMVLGNSLVNVGIGTSSPNSSALLDLSSTSKGLLMPRMASSQRTAIASPAKGLTVFDNDSSYFFYYNGSSWLSLKTSIPTSNFWMKNNSKLTLTDSTNLVGVGKTPSYKLDVAGPVNADSIMLGGATALSVKGTDNMFIGPGAGTNNSGSDNYFSGAHAGINNSGNYGVFIGSQAGNSNNGDNNTFIGYHAGLNNTTGGGNYFTGAGAGLSNSTGSNNYFSGTNAGQYNTSASNNHFEGYYAGSANTTGTANQFIGWYAGGTNTIGSDNLFIGYTAGGSNVIGNRNLYIGESAGVRQCHRFGKSIFRLRRRGFQFRQPELFFRV